MEGFWKEIKIHLMNTHIIIFKQNVADKFAKFGVNDNNSLCYRLDLIQYDLIHSLQISLNFLYFLN